MINKPLNPFQNVVAGQKATLQIPAEALTLCKIMLDLSGTTFTKSLIDLVVIKLGARTIWQLKGSELNSINNYKNQADNTKKLMIDFTERDQPDFPVKEVGGLDLMTLTSVGLVTLEVTINSGAVAPALNAFGYFEQRQGNAAILKMVPFTTSTPVSGKFSLPLQLRGALIKRLWVFYTGTNWTSSTDGNVNRVEVKKNSYVMFDQTDLQNRFTQSDNKKVPQANLYVIDFISDNNYAAQVPTMHAATENGKSVLVYDNIEFNTWITDAGGSVINCVAEVLDAPTNL